MPDQMKNMNLNNLTLKSNSTCKFLYSKFAYCMIINFNLLILQYNIVQTEDLNGPPPIVPPRRKHSGKMLKQPTDKSGSLYSVTSVTSQQFNGLPPIPKVKMGAGLIKIFDQCPLVIHCASTWIHPDTKDQLILFASDLGIYSLNLKMYLSGDSTLELVGLNA